MIERKDQKTEDTWDLSLLSADDKAWEKDMAKLRKRIACFPKYKGTLLKSSDSLYEALVFLKETSQEAERLGNYAFLKFSADASDSLTQKHYMMYDSLSSLFSEKTSWLSPELLSVPEEDLKLWMKEPRYKEFRVWLRRELRERKHVLSEKEEKLLSLYSLCNGSAQKAFSDLNNIELEFKDVRGSQLSHATFSKFIRDSDEGVREEAYRNYYEAFDKHKHVISDLYTASVNEDIFLSRARNFRSSLEAALFPDNIRPQVYLSLIEAVHQAFPALHEYYEVKAKVLGKDKLKHWDVYIPMAPVYKAEHSYDEAVGLISEAVKVLGEEYRQKLISGLTTERWVDRYENKGKRSGAFSSGCYTGNPYILTNFEPAVLDSVFTLIHEGGHSMHSWYSRNSNPYMCYSYSIFEAEVASTFNENLLSHYLIDHSNNDDEKAYLIGKNLDDIVATLFRQTMFAEFELLIHQKAEKGEPVTLDIMRDVYHTLLESYFGPQLEFAEVSDLECLRIPHFYTAFYCYKYATGLSASIALSHRVLSGGEKERNDYLTFLRSGGSRYPIQALKVAGVDMSTPAPVKAATDHFTSLLKEFRALRGI